MLMIGGLVFILLDKWFEASNQRDEQEIKYPSAFKIGLFQCIAMIPGVSRSAATIIGGLTQKLSKKQAAEFSFFLAVPTMFAATCKKSYDYYKLGITLNATDINLLIVGNVVGFVVALIAIKSFIHYLSNNGFKIFGYYRIAIGASILILYAFGVPLSIN
jgi:undecaprenyl-diphosphatase